MQSKAGFEIIPCWESYKSHIYRSKHITKNKPGGREKTDNKSTLLEILTPEDFCHQVQQLRGCLLFIIYSSLLNVIQLFALARLHHSKCLTILLHVTMCTNLVGGRRIKRFNGFKNLFNWSTCYKLTTITVHRDYGLKRENLKSTFQDFFIKTF